MASTPYLPPPSRTSSHNGRYEGKQHWNVYLWKEWHKPLLIPSVCCSLLQLLTFGCDFFVRVVATLLLQLLLSCCGVCIRLWTFGAIRSKQSAFTFSPLNPEPQNVCQDFFFFAFCLLFSYSVDVLITMSNRKTLNTFAIILDQRDWEKIVP